MKVTAILTCTLLLLASVPEISACREIQKDFHKSFDVEKGARLRLRHGDGDVTIKPWNRDQVDVTVTYRAESKSLGFGREHDFTVEFRQKDDVIEVIGKEKSSSILGLHFFRTYEYSYKIQAPPYVDLDLRGDDGDVAIEKWAGAIECRIDDGDVELRETDSPKTRILIEDGDTYVENHRGEFFLSGDDGDVFITGCRMPLCRVHIEDGHIRIKRCEGDFEVQTCDGDIKMYSLLGRGIEIETEDGDVDLDLLKTDDIDLDIRTGDGDVTLGIEPGTSATFSVDVDDGSIRVDLPSATDIEKRRHWVKGTINGGKGRIRIRTNDARVIIKESK
jgi:hypothetical protein